MKLTTFFILLACLHVNAEGYAQKITLFENNASMEKLFKDIKTQTGYIFFYDKALLKNAKPVTIRVKDAPLENVLNICFRNQPLTYSIIGQTIVVKKKIIEQELQSSSSALQGPPIVSPPIEVRGRVIDKEGEPIVGASVTVEGSRHGTSTNSSGVFELIGIPENAHLMISAVGYTPISIRYTPNTVLFESMGERQQGTAGKAEDHYKSSGTLNEDGSITVKLARMIKSDETIVITGLFNRSSESFTGASKTISGDEIRQINVKNVFSSISALDPAFRIVYNNAIGGDINQLPQIQMRGENSFPNLSGDLSNNPTQPLFILDGFEVSLQRIVDLDINLIENITLLKDASATAIYGSRGANGVMVVTTIPPQPGQIQVSFNNDFSLTTPQLSEYNLLDAKDKLDFEKRAGVYTSEDATEQYKLDLLYNERYKMYLKGINTDWLALPVRTGYSNRSSLRLQGGDKAFRYGIQFTADLQQGVMKGQVRNNYSGQIDLTYVVKKFRFSNSLRVFNNKAENSPFGSFSQYVSANPYNSPYNANGNLQQYLESFTIDNVPYTRLNPLYDTKFNTINESEYFGVTNNFSLRYNIFPNLFVESNLSLTKQTDQSNQFYSALDSRFANIADINQKGSYMARSGNAFGFENTTTANYNLQLGKNLIFSTLGFNTANNTNNYYTLEAQGFPSDQLDNLLFAAQYKANGRPAGEESRTSRVGFVYNVNYSYDNRFLADLSARRDGSSQYGTNKRFGNFWSAGLGWNLHNEGFIKQLNVVNRMKLRASYGVTGSLNIPAYSAQYRYSYGTSSSYYGDIGAVLSNMGNPDLTWQSVYKLNVGADISLLKERLLVSIDFYRENTVDAVSSISLAPSTGFTSYQANLGELQNKGFEFSGRYEILREQQRGLLWSVFLNGYTNVNILKKLSNKLTSVNEKLEKQNETQTLPNIQLREGESVNTIYAVRSLGVDPATGAEVYLTKDGEMTYVWNAADKVPVGINQPKWNGNFGTNFSYLGFEFNAIFNLQFGGQIYNQTLINRVESVNPNDNVDRRAYDLGWAKPGDISQYTRITTSSVPTRLTSRFVQDERSLRLTSASVGYNFMRTNLIEMLGLRSLQVTLSTNDLIWISSVQVERGTDNPFYRNYAFSLKLGL